MRRYGLIGQKLGHSFSKRHFSQKFEREGIDARYDLFELGEIGEFPQLLQRIPSLHGLNVTIPYKTAVIPYLDGLSPEAKEIGAVNTIKIVEGKTIGHNTDVYGFAKSLRGLLGDTQISHVLILGTGGASKAVEYVCRKYEGMQCLFVSRTPSTPHQISYEQLAVMPLPPYKLIVNTTPLGMYPAVDVAPLFPYHKLDASFYAFDLIYNPAQTRFMQLAAQAGSYTLNGMEMLLLQAEKAWEIWNA